MTEINKDRAKELEEKLKRVTLSKDKEEEKAEKPVFGLSEQDTSRIKNDWELRDKNSNWQWTIFVRDDCEYSQKAIQILREHEPAQNIAIKKLNNIQTQDYISRGWNFTPLIFRNGNMFGSLPELENYYKRNFYQHFGQIEGK